jgi:hypothetical protein
MIPAHAPRATRPRSQDTWPRTQSAGGAYVDEEHLFGLSRPWTAFFLNQEDGRPVRRASDHHELLEMMGKAHGLVAILLLSTRDYPPVVPDYFLAAQGARWIDSGSRTTSPS